MLSPPGLPGLYHVCVKIALVCQLNETTVAIQERNQSRMVDYYNTLIVRSNISTCTCVCVCVCVCVRGECVCVCVCVCERERERERIIL